MSKLKLVGLIATGRMVESPLMRYPELAAGLGPVVAESKRVASRYANALRVGHAAEREELSQCKLVLIQAPRGAVDWAVRELMAVEGSRRSHAVVWLNQGLGVRALAPLRERRAMVAAAGFAPTRVKPMLVVEGDAGAVRAVREWARPGRLRCVELPAGGAAMYQAGLILAGSLVSPVVDAALRSFRAAGFGMPESKRMLDEVVDEALRDYQAHGRKKWVNPGVERGQDCLMEADAALARYYRRMLRSTLEYYGQPVDDLS
jgi:hypothetical protein